MSSHHRIASAVLAGACAAALPVRVVAEPEIRGVSWLLYGPAFADRFLRPGGVAADSVRGILVVADTGRQRLVIVDEKGRSRGTIPMAASPQQSSEPRSVAVDARGRVYVQDALKAEIEVLTPAGARLALFDPRPADLVQTHTQAVAVGASGRIYVLLVGERSGYVVLDSKGRLLSQVGFTEDLAFHGPASIAVSPDESAIAVVDPPGERVVFVFGSDGRLQANFGPHGEGEGTFSMAAHAAWGPGNTLWVTDQLRHSVSVFDRAGRFLGRVGGFGREPGQFEYPIGCAFLGADRVAVLERAGSRLQVLEVNVGDAWEPQTGQGTFDHGDSGAHSSAEVD
jgi:DNA-binding beta-propeller fold protein YncE